MVQPETIDDDIRGDVFEIQRFSIHDGPGIRTTVFLKGCPLRCAWCHNPEGMDAGAVLSFQPERCIGCGRCVRACPRGAHRMVEGRHVFDRTLCGGCGACAGECWAQALERVGGETSVGAVMAEVVRDKPFYESSGGGLTLSGGEPMAQVRFTSALLQAAGREGLHRCVETGGAVCVSAFEAVMGRVELFLFDLKDTNNAFHVKHTGVPNTQIVANLRYLHDHGAKVRLRLPFVPGFNDRPDHFEGIAALVGTLPNLCGVEIMPYHNLGLDKEGRFGLSRDVVLPAESVREAVLGAWADRLGALGVAVINGMAGPHP